MFHFRPLLADQMRLISNQRDNAQLSHLYKVRETGTTAVNRGIGALAKREKRSVSVMSDEEI